MKCPVCKDVTLTMSERQGIEIDYCPQCRGVWLDRGELDKLLERAQASVEPAPAVASMPRPEAPPHGFGHSHQPNHPQHHGGYGQAQQGKYYGKKPKSWLSDIFD